MKISKTGSVLSASELSNTKLSYYEGDIKKYITDYSPNNIEASYQNLGLISTRLIGLISANNKIKTYYIEYPNNWKSDTLYVDYLPPTLVTNCRYVQNQVRLNGQSAIIDNSFHLFSPVYIINIP